MNQEERNALRGAVQLWRRTLENDIEEQIGALYGIRRPTGATAGKGKKAAGDSDPLAELVVLAVADVPRVAQSRRLQERRRIILTAIEDSARRRMASAGEKFDSGQVKPLVLDFEAYLRACAFTVLNRLAGIKLLEARGHYLPSLTGSEDAPAAKFFRSVAGPSLPAGEDPYMLFVDLLMADVSTQVPSLRDASGRYDLVKPDKASVLALGESMEALGEVVWKSDETLGWIYQYFTPEELRKRVRKESPTPRSSDELAFRNQFFTPQYVVRFLVQNTLGRMWLEMHADTHLADTWEFLVRDETTPRPFKDPRNLRVIDPACGSGHFLLYAFEVLHDIYSEVYEHAELGQGLRAEFPDRYEFFARLPELIIERNLYGVDIDRRVAQVTQVALYLKALGYDRKARPMRGNIVHAQQLPGNAAEFGAFVAAEFTDHPRREFIQQALSHVHKEFLHADELGIMLKTSDTIEQLTRRTPLWNETQLLPDVLAALDAYAEHAADAGEVRAFMFGDDSRQALRLLELMSLEYDVVLMNPPFGAAARDSKGTFEKLYPRTKNDLYAAFVERGLNLLVPRGRLGCLSSRTGFFLKSFTKWREEILLGEGHLEVVADLGYGVLDKAMVEVAAYVVEKQ
ncbi:hypothetical protein SAMN04488058_104215 [Deinococcus reticulitermitis]|uniref:site-specific DNA-methyltransferase (adenine-specific) n=1 Tax=Deinococcus reticulitermitis TaxID=856736 RepID=A0A1H6WU24_9DEIO|nr:DNA methyltransferase [Deinococcus reticulitermitis]SEJ17737.1 hypothetical protein SAMN04488058_104215 [Deinococcus reticulitermitis]